MSLAAAALAVALALPSTDPSPVGRVLFHLKDPRITESSGIAVATREPGVWFTHNDSGDSARFFALGPTGRTLATYDVDGASAVDWEDMAAAPRDGVPTLWIGDIGDNSASRPDISVYAVPEPGVFPGSSGGIVHVTAVRYRFRYPTGPRDAESLMVDPRSGRMYVATKSVDGQTEVFVAPEHQSTTAVNELGELSHLLWTLHNPHSFADVPLQLSTTGGAFSPDGRSLVLRTYTDAYLFHLHGTGVLAVAAALSAGPDRMPLPGQPQGEGICFRRDSKALVISSEHAGSAVDEVLLPQFVTGSPATASAASSAARSSVTRSASTPPSAQPQPSTGTPTAAPTTAPQAVRRQGHSLLPGVGGAVVVGGLAVAVLLRRRRAGPARSSR